VGAALEPRPSRVCVWSLKLITTGFDFAKYLVA
jgi:hypothetical protein